MGWGKWAEGRPRPQSLPGAPLVSAPFTSDLEGNLDHRPLPLQPQFPVS